MNQTHSDELPVVCRIDNDQDLILSFDGTPKDDSTKTLALRFKDLILRNAPSVDPYLFFRVRVYDKYHEDYSLAIDTKVNVTDFVKPG